jgi:hypothetical protein
LDLHRHENISKDSAIELKQSKILQRANVAALFRS